KAIDLYQQALGKDPSYAPAYSGIADCYSFLGSMLGVLRPAEAFPRAKAAAEKAVALDASLSEAHASLGLCALFSDWDWPAAEREFRRSLELNPENAIAHRTYGVFLVAMGKTHDALRETQLAAELDPLSALTAHFPGLVLVFSRRYD